MHKPRGLPKVLFVSREPIYPVKFCLDSQYYAHRMLRALAGRRESGCMALGALYSAWYHVRENPFHASSRYEAAGRRFVRGHAGYLDLREGYPIRLVRWDFDAVLEATLARFRPTVLWVQPRHAASILAAGRRFGVPGIVDLGDAPSAHLRDEIAKIPKKGSVFICGSEAMRRWALGACGVNAMVVPPLMSPDETMVRWKEDGCISMIGHRFDQGVGTFMRIAEAFPKERFLLVKGFADPFSDGAVKSLLQLLPNVTMISAPKDIRDVLRRTRILVVPSAEDTAPVRLLAEAQASGIPVLASRLASLSHKIAEERLLVDRYLKPGPWIRALRRLLRDPGGLKSHSLAAFDRARRDQPSQPAIVRDFLNILSEVGGCAL